MLDDWPERFADLLAAPSPAVFTTYRRDGSAAISSVWFRFRDLSFEVVVAVGDVKLRRIERRPECSLTVFETVAPFRGVTVEGRPDTRPDDGDVVRAGIARRYLGPEQGRRFVEQRQVPGVVVRLGIEGARAWDLSGILPA